MSDVSLPDPLAAVDSPPASSPAVPSSTPKQSRKRTRTRPTARAKVERPPAAPEPRRRGPGRPPAVTPLVDQLRTMYALLGATAMMWRPTVGATILAQMDQCAESVNALAEANPAVKRALSKGMMAGQVMGVVMAHAPIVVALMQPEPSVDAPGADVPDLEAMFRDFAAQPPAPNGSEFDAAPAAD